LYNVLDAGSVGVSSNIDDQPHLITGDLSTTPFHALACSSFASIGSQTPQQQATPGVFQRCRVPYTIAAIP